LIKDLFKEEAAHHSKNHRCRPSCNRY